MSSDEKSYRAIIGGQTEHSFSDLFGMVNQAAGRKGAQHSNNHDAISKLVTALTLDYLPEVDVSWTLEDTVRSLKWSYVDKEGDQPENFTKEAEEAVKIARQVLVAVLGKVPEKAEETIELTEFVYSSESRMTVPKNFQRERTIQGRVELILDEMLGLVDGVKVKVARERDTAKLAEKYGEGGNELARKNLVEAKEMVSKQFAAGASIAG